MYCFTASSTKTYTVKTTCSSGDDLDCKVYDAYGSEIASYTATGQVNTTISMQAGKTYYFDIYNYSKKVTDYVFTIS